MVRCRGLVVAQQGGVSTLQKTSSAYAVLELESVNHAWWNTVNSASICYTARPDNTQQAEITTLAHIYAFVLARHADRHASKEATCPGGPDDPERRSNEIRAKKSIPQG